MLYNPIYHLLAVLGKLGLVQTLRADGHFTLFAPTNAAFSRIKPSLLSRLLAMDSCLGSKCSHSHRLANKHFFPLFLYPSEAAL